MHLYLSGSELFRCSICAPICILNFSNFSGTQSSHYFFFLRFIRCYLPDTVSSMHLLLLLKKKIKISTSIAPIIYGFKINYTNPILYSHYSVLTEKKTKNIQLKFLNRARQLYILFCSCESDGLVCFPVI